MTSAGSGGVADFIFTVLPYLALGVFLLGSALKVTAWWQTPVPLRIPLPTTSPGRWDARLNLVLDALTFRALWRRDKVYWLVSLLFHFSLLLVLLRHLRYFLQPIPGWVAALQGPGLVAGYVLPATLLVLIGRRLYVPTLIYTSTLTDFLALLLLLSISLTGLAARLLFRVDVMAVKDWGLGLWHLNPQPVPAPGLWGYHFILAMILLVYFPFSKLTHGFGTWFSPTLNPPGEKVGALGAGRSGSVSAKDDGP